MKKDVDNLLEVKNYTCFLKLDNIKKLFNYKDRVNELINHNGILCFTVIVESNDDLLNMTQSLKRELYEWITSIDILLIIVIDKKCCEDLLEVAMMFDIRLGGKNLSVTFPKDVSSYVFDFNERCQLLMGKTQSIYTYENLLNSTLNANDIYFYKLINKVIDFGDLQNEIEKYINYILRNKSTFQIKAILKCFKHYSRLGLNEKRKILLKEEKEQFHILAIRS